MGWLDLSNVSNIFRQSYVNGFLDVSRTLIVRGDASLNSNLFIAGDVSLNGNLRANYPNSSIPPSAIIGGVSTGIFINDISASKRMVVAGDVSFNSNLFIAGDVSLNGNLTANYPNSSIPPSAIIGGVSTGIFINDISASKRMFVDGDVSLNSKLFVAGDVSLNGSVAIGNDITIGGRLNVKNYTNQNIINTTTTNYQLIVSEDLSLNGRLVVSGDSSFNGNVYATGFITAETQSITDNSTRVATTEYARSLVDTSLNNALANYSTKSVIDSSLALYSTKAAVDTSLGLYYTKTAIDASVNTNYYNKSTIDASVNTNYYNKSTIDASINTNYYNKSTIDASVNNVLVNNYSTKSVIDTSLALYYTKTDSDASMNTNYYNKSTIDSSINNLLNTSYSTKSIIDTSLNLKANIESPTFTGTAVIPTGNITTLNVFGDASMNGNLMLNGTFQCMKDITVNTMTFGFGSGAIATNTAIGYQSLNTNVTGASITAVGYQALTTLKGNYNTGMGYQALKSNNGGGSYCTAVGYQAGYANQNGNNNTSFGSQALFATTSGQNNVGVGVGSLYTNTSGNSNTAIGSSALYSVNASSNTAVGYYALTLTTSSNNTAFGYQAGNTNTSGNNNTFIGYQATANANNYTYSTALGAGATITGSNQVVLGTASEKVFIPGDASLNGNIVIGRNLTVKGNLAVQNYTNQNIINTTTTNYQLIVSEDISLNGRLVVSGDSSFNGNLYTTGFITATTQSMSDNSTRVATTAYARNLVDTSLNNALSNYSTKSVIDASLALKANLESPTFTGTVGGISKSMVDLGNVDNTSDANKPVSSATQTALDLKANLASPTFTGTVGGISKSMVDLGNVDNTSDANKPVSSATQTALDLKANLANPTFTGTAVIPTGNLTTLNVFGDASLNGNIVIGRNLTILGNIAVQNYSNQNIINTTTTNYQLIVSEDISLNGRLVVSGDSSFNGNVYTTGFITAATESITDNSTRLATTAYTRNLVDTSLNNALANYSTKSIIDASLGLYYTITAIDASVNTNYYNKSTIDTSINNLISNINLTNYYTKSVIDASVNDILTNNYSTKAVIDASLALKANLESPTFTGTVGGISKSMVGLGNVDNTSDANKPVSSATQTALGLKANLESPTFTGTVGGISKSMVDLGNVDNTSDANKPVSSATQTALDLKANIASPTFTGTAVIPTGNLTTLNVFGDASLNGNIVIGRNLTVLGNIAVQNYTNQSIINTTTTNYQLIVSEDISLNGRLVVSGDVSFNGNLSAKSINVKDISGVNNFFGNLQYTYNTPNTATFDENGFAILKNIDSSATVIYSTIDMSINGNLFVGNDLSYAGNLYVKPNSIDSNAIRYGINNQFGVFQFNYNTPNTASYDSEGFGILRYIDSSSQVLYSKTDLSLNGNLYARGDISLNGNLYARGDISLNGNLYVKNEIGIGTFNPAASLHIYEPNGTTLTSTAASIILEHGNAGGTSSILFKSVSNAGSDYGYIYYVDDITGSTTGEKSALCIGVENDGGAGAVSDVLVLNRNGSHVGIGITNPSTALHVIGTTTSTAFNASSDYRLKDNITNLDGTYIIDNLRPVKYTFKSNNSEQIGFIAHEVQEHYPMLVDGEKDGEIHQSINMNGIIPILVNDLKRSKERINELETRMKHLEEQLSRII
jgi:hypothetical protein